MHTHWIDIFDRADDDGIVLFVADNLHLIFFPTQKRFFDQHLGRRAGIKPAGNDLDKLFPVIGNAATGAAQREAGADD